MPCRTEFCCFFNLSNIIRNNEFSNFLEISEILITNCDSKLITITIKPDRFQQKKNGFL